MSNILTAATASCSAFKSTYDNLLMMSKEKKVRRRGELYKKDLQQINEDKKAGFHLNNNYKLKNDRNDKPIDVKI